MTDTKKTAKKTATKTGASRKSANVWTEAERAAMVEGARERKSASRLSPADERAAGELEIRTKIAEMPEPDRSMAERVHALVVAAAPSFMPKTYYGMPAYAKDGKTICYFKPASKFKERYSTFGFEAHARIDDGEMWPVSFALTKLTPAVEARIAALLKKAAG